MTKKAEKEIKTQEGEVEKVEVTEQNSQEVESKAPETVEDLGVIEKIEKAPKPKQTQAKAKEVQKPEEVKPKSEESPKAEVKDPVMDFDIDEDKTYIFKMKDPSYRMMIPATATVYDEVNRAPKTITLTDTEESPYAEDHGEGVKPSRKPLMFLKGELKIKGTNKPAIRYLLAYDGFEGKSTTLPGNRQIKGMYSLFVPEEEQARKLQLEKDRMKAKNIILEASDEEVGDFVTGLKNSIVTGTDARLEALSVANAKPQAVINQFENPAIRTKSKLIKASSKGLIAVVNGQIVSATGKILYTTTGSDVLLDAAKEVVGDTPKGKLLLDVLAEV